MVIRDFNQGTGFLLFDLRGGTYTWDMAFRRRCLMYRCCYIMSLWDMSAKVKVWLPGLGTV